MKRREKIGDAWERRKGPSKKKTERESVNRQHEGHARRGRVAGMNHTL